MSELTIDPDRYAAINLKSGAHSSIDEGACLMEAVSYLAGEEFSDHPKCVSPVLGTFGRGLNDVLPADLRQELKALIPSLPGTANDDLDETRSYMALDWLIRTWLPTWLDLVPSCRADATALRDLGRIVDLVAAERAGDVVRRSRKNATAAWAAAGEAAGEAAWAAAREAAWAAARAAAREAAWAAAGAAAWAAAGEAAREAAGEAARAAAREAAWAAAREAARAAAWAALKPTVEELQRSAIDLFRDMIKDPR